MPPGGQYHVMGTCCAYIRGTIACPTYIVVQAVSTIEEDRQEEAVASRRRKGRTRQPDAGEATVMRGRGQSRSRRRDFFGTRRRVHTHKQSLSPNSYHVQVHSLSLLSRDPLPRPGGLPSEQLSFRTLFFDTTDTHRRHSIIHDPLYPCRPPSP